KRNDATLRAIKTEAIKNAKSASLTPSHGAPRRNVQSATTIAMMPSANRNGRAKSMQPYASVRAGAMGVPIVTSGIPRNATAPAVMPAPAKARRPMTRAVTRLVRCELRLLVLEPSLVNVASDVQKTPNLGVCYRVPDGRARSPSPHELLAPQR